MPKRIYATPGSYYNHAVREIYSKYVPDALDDWKKPSFERSFHLVVVKTIEEAYAIYDDIHEIFSKWVIRCQTDLQGQSFTLSDFNDVRIIEAAPKSNFKKSVFQSGTTLAFSEQEFTEWRKGLQDVVIEMDAFNYENFSTVFERCCYEEDGVKYIKIRRYGKADRRVQYIPKGGSKTKSFNCGILTILVSTGIEVKSETLTLTQRADCELRLSPFVFEAKESRRKEAREFAVIKTYNN